MSGPSYQATAVNELLDAIEAALDTIHKRQEEPAPLVVEIHRLVVEIHAACTAKPDGPSPLMEAMASIVVLLNRITATQAEHSEVLVELRTWMGLIERREVR